MRTSRVRIGGLLFVALALFAAACGDDDTATEPDPTTTTTTAAPDDGEPDETGTDETDGTGTDDTETDPPVELTDSYRGVTEDSIKLGIVLFDTDAILDLGVDVGYGDHAQHYQVVIDEMNEAGGILGRQIEPIYKFVSPVDPEEADRVCTELTEDDEVFAVLGTARPPENLLCYTETADTPFIGAPTGDLSNAIFDRSVDRSSFLVGFPAGPTARSWRRWSSMTSSTGRCSPCTVPTRTGSTASPPSSKREARPRWSRASNSPTKPTRPRWRPNSTA